MCEGETYHWRSEEVMMLKRGLKRKREERVDLNLNELDVAFYQAADRCHVDASEVKKIAKES